eukprot:TRINITY_DN1290_c1_g1_i1.p1 TRINITY_DN1290_c1_g1~~TRINITY_DN1290_c1_g1_i1.p1  ORF type:complete len:77 (-),score=11.87 TRINITY_DN1290_c1_g1_i1:10-240(-)
MTLFKVIKRDPNGRNGWMHVKLRECHMARGKKCLLWVDDNHVNNKALMEQTESVCSFCFVWVYGVCAWVSRDQLDI